MEAQRACFLPEVTEQREEAQLTQHAAPCRLLEGLAGEPRLSHQEDGRMRFEQEGATPWQVEVGSGSAGSRDQKKFPKRCPGNVFAKLKRHSFPSHGAQSLSPIPSTSRTEWGEGGICSSVSYGGPEGRDTTFSASPSTWHSVSLNKDSLTDRHQSVSHVNSQPSPHSAP